jgi:antitoxin (DNA-binding transcriptional repressor) of toxin-antitoxin stability system
MKPKVINVREFQRNMSAVIDEVMAGQSFEVVRNARPAFTMSPPVKKTVKKRKKFTQEEYLAALRKMQFRSGEKNLSQKIDEIVYK